MRNPVQNSLKKALQSKKSGRRNRRGRFSTIETLESRLAMAITIQFDYSLDEASTNWFGHPTLGQLRKDTLQQAANDLVSPLQDTLAAIQASGSNTWTASFPHPGTGAPVSIPNLFVPADTLIVYVGSGRSIDSDARADSGFSYFGDTAWGDAVEGRGEPGALLATPTDIGPWGGAITFNPASSWSYDNGATSGDNFYSTAQHELGHLLGISGGGTNPTSWETHVSGGNFTGPKAVAANGGNPIPVGTPGHFASTVTNEGRRATMAETLDPTARGFTDLDYAALDDIGWDVAVPVDDDGPDEPTTPPGSANGTETVITGIFLSPPPFTPPAGFTLRNTSQATVDGKLYQGSTNDDENVHVQVSTDGGATFGTPIYIGEKARGNPSLTAIDSKLYICWTGISNLRLNVAVVDLDSSGNPTGTVSEKETLGDASDHAPAIGSLNGVLYTAHSGTDLRLNINFKAKTGPRTSWSAPVVTNEFTERVPVLTTHSDGQIYVFWYGTDNAPNYSKINQITETVPRRQKLVVGPGGKVDVDGDQRGLNHNDVVEIDRTSAGGVKFTLNGEVTEYAPGAITSIDVRTGGGTNTVRLLTTFSNIPITVNGNGTDEFVLAGGLPAATFTQDANGLIGWGTLNVGGQLIHHRSIETVNGVTPDVGGIVLTSVTINENGAATVTGSFADAGSYSTHSVSVNWGDGTSTPLSRLDLGDRTFTLTHQYRDDNPTGTSSDSYTITATITDNENRSDTASTSLTVNNVAPQLSGVTATTSINEDGTVTVSGSLSDVGTLDSFKLVINWGEGTPQTLTLPVGTTMFSATHQYRDDNPTGTASDVYTIGLALTDDDTGAATASVTTTVRNVAPVITAHDNSNPQSNKAVEGQSITIHGSFTDVGTLDTHVAQIDWGDGTVTNGSVTESNGSGTFAAAHAFNRGGIFAITTTVRDDDGGTSTAVETVFVTGAGISNVGGKRVLFVVGTDGQDNVVVQQVNSTVYVVANFLNAPGGLRTFSAAAIDEIRVVLGAGNDTSVSAGMIAKPLLVDGGAGDDVIVNDANQGIFGTILLGGDGKDTLVGTNARDIVIGGDGADSLTGIGGQDILIGGLTTYETGVADDNILAQEAALLSMLAEWNSGQSMAVRRANLLGTGSGSTFNSRRNGSSFFRLNETVFDDLDRDVITGGSPDADWFLLFGNDLGADYLTVLGDVNGF